jgi:hypothetical protein
VGSLQENPHNAGYPVQIPGGGFGPERGGVLYDNSVGPSLGYWDWINPYYQWGDDLHGISSGTRLPAHVSGLVYGFFNTFSSAFITHTIKIYDMVPPSNTHGGSSQGGFHPVFDKGPLKCSITLPFGHIAAGSYTVAVSGITCTIGGSGAWVKFQERNPNATFAGPTFWLTGGIPVHGFSHDTLNATAKYPTGVINLHYPHALAPYSNIMMVLTGKHIPEPAAITLIGLAGALVLAWRRRARV